ncbi:MAG: hypothetical protein JXA25_00870 [Anaerolineales bacterium]|nr:hypothetical protein [Anaerolineales bacterium]
MRKTTPVLFLLSLAGAVLGLWLTAEGVYASFSGSFLTSGGLWQDAARAAGLGPHQLYWPLVWLGLNWIGVLLAVWTQSSWRYTAVLVAAVLSLFFLGWGTVLAATALLCVVTPSGRRLLRDQEPG